MVTLSNKEMNNPNIKMSIQVSLSGLSFCAFSKGKNKIIYFKEVQFQKKLNPIQLLKEVEKTYEDEAFLQHTKAEVIVLFSNELYSLVPKVFFSEENASEYLKYNTKILETDYLAHDELEKAEIVNIYIPYANINNFFFEKYGEFEYKHSITVLTEEILKESDPEGATKVYLHCFTGGYDLIVIQKGKLLLANTFKCKTKEDFIYYLLFTAEQLNLDPDTFELVLLGKITKNSNYYKIAYTYIRNINFLETSFGIVYAGKEEPPKGNTHYILLKTL